MKLFLLLILFSIVIQSQDRDESFLFEGEKRISNLQMLTDSGENAEAYLSFSENQLVFQSTREGLECDQIFVMSIHGEESRMVSTGKGKTTCAYFLPGDSTIVYASTHLSGDDCPPPPDRSKGYVWQLYDSFDIFVTNLRTGEVKQLTDAPGYDAEATVSPRGDKIIFTSTRDGDPELYLMNIDGSNQIRLTNEKGYDGGAFFSYDGSKIIFRASRPKTDQELADYDELVKYGYVRPTALEIFVMDSDGSNITQVTNFGKASFAPFMHPDGKRIIFSSNVNSQSGRNFDLYLINTDGSGFEQITFNESFDGFPVFTSDGKKLIFASNRFNKNPNDTNIFVADWND